MLIKRSNIKTLANILSGIKINKLSDKNVKLVLIHDYILLRKKSAEIQNSLDDIVSKFREDWMDEILDVQKLRNEGKEISGHDEFLNAEEDANGAIANLLGVEEDLDIKAASMEAFVSSFTEDDITLEYIAFLAENGLLE